MFGVRHWIELVIVIIIYFIPTIVGALAGARGLGVLFLTNLFAGWTVFGWILLLFQGLAYRRSYRMEAGLTPYEEGEPAPDPARARPRSLYPELKGLD